MTRSGKLKAFLSSQRLRRNVIVSLSHRNARRASLAAPPPPANNVRGVLRSFSGALPSPVEERLLLYLNKDTWVGEDGAELVEIVRAAWQHQVEVLIVHENDPARNGCEFGHFFGTTPQSLIDAGIYKTIAIALHPAPHREVSLALVAQACGARPSKYGKKEERGKSPLAKQQEQEVAQFDREERKRAEQATANHRLARLRQEAHERGREERRSRGREDDDDDEGASPGSFSENSRQLGEDSQLTTEEVGRLQP